MKRFVIILLAILSGLSVPQAVAAASGRAEASVVARPIAVHPAQPGVEARAHLARPTAAVGAAPRRAALWLDPAPLTPTVHQGDRARE